MRLIAKSTILRAGIWLLMLASIPSSRAQESQWLSDWPVWASPKDIAGTIAERFVKSPHLVESGPLNYPEVCTWYGALSFAEVTGDKELARRLKDRFEPLLGPDERDRVPNERHVDYEVFGVVPLELYTQTHEGKYLNLGKSFSDRQWDSPRRDGLSGETRFWIDDMYMITMLQVEAYRATGDRQYIDRAALELAAYLDKLQQPNGLFYHSPEAPFFWGRGNGWVAAGMAELLCSLPTDNPNRSRILAGYRKMMNALLQFQGKDGMWRELTDREDAWPETSSTGMFAFAMITGVKSGWLDANDYGPAARKAWLALVGYIDQNNQLTSVCETSDTTDNASYYLTRKRVTGDLHGEAPLLWAATALLR